MQVKGLKMQTKITLLSFGLVVISIIIGGIVLVENFTSVLEKELGSRALAIARTVAQMEEIQRYVGKPGGEEVIQPIAEKIRLATNVEYIVVLDMNKIRYSHPLQKMIGTKFSGGDEGPAFADHEYISRAEGVLGPSVRAFVPIKTNEGTKQVGVVVVGVLTPTVSKILHGIRMRLYLSLLAGLAVGILGSMVLVNNIKKSMFNMEPEEIARLLEERIAVFQSIGEGIIAIDKEDRITIINDEARRIIGVEGEVVGKSIWEVIPDSNLPATARTGEAQYNQERLINNTVILVNRIPIKVKGEIVGAVATFKDKTEVSKLAEELTGVKKFIEALRVQNHEYMNKLHTIAGLIQLKKYDKALDYIFAETEEQQELTQFLSRRIKDYSVAGLLLGKYSRAKELKIDLVIDKSSRLTYLPRGIDSSALVIILGNLLENSMEAVEGLEFERRKVFCRLEEKEKSLKIVVEDTGRGIPRELVGRIFEPGFSTKKGKNRGVGLALVKRYVDNVGGKISVETEEGKGTRITVVLPVDQKSKG
ncbi:DcuS/MalK family sensor histidine kinase [Calderihabitans maritimus]|uniref:DcuS/MalK family sensor histidine kinase n=1 Tax=Calderihabitans maritimus TaxID=1246530 RepID=UPI000B5023B3